MKIKDLTTLLPFSLLLFVLLSCGNNNDKPDPEPICDLFSSADSVCFCKTHEENVRCNKFTLSTFSKEQAGLTPHIANGTLWSKGFVIGHSIYVIDRESASPHAFWKLDVDKNETWEAKADFPGSKYGLTGSANGKGYASSYASKKFWEYDPTTDQWTPLNDLPFSASETHWVEYQGKFYVPAHDGIFEFNAFTKQWNKFSDQTSSGFGAIFIIDDDMYWYNINDSYMNNFNLADKSFKKIDVPEDFGSSVAFNSPFVIGTTAFVVSNRSLWILDEHSGSWYVDEDAITSGGAYGDDVFVVDDKIYLIDNGHVKLFSSE
jgi:hypothetical protein